MYKKLTQYILTMMIIVLLTNGISPASAQVKPVKASSMGNGFTYAGQLIDDERAYQGNCDFRFSLWDAAIAGTQIGDTQTISNVLVRNGLFIATLNQNDEFGGSPFTGLPRWLELAVRCPAGSGDYATLLPRQELTSAPYATFSASSPWSGLIEVPAGFADDEDNDTLAGLSCGGGQIPEWNGTNWACTADNDTTYSAGDGLDLNDTQFKLDYQAVLSSTRPANLVIVAKQNGDFDQVQTALDSITDASPTHPYLVWVAPGVYTETVTMRPYIVLQGAGKGSTVISNPGGDSSSGTLFGAANTTLRDLTVRSVGEETYAYGIRNSASDFVIENVLVQVVGTYTSGTGIFLEDTATNTRIKDCMIEVSGTGSGIGIMATTNLRVDDTSLRLTSTNGGTGVNAMAGVLNGIRITLESPWNTLGISLYLGSNITLSNSMINSNGVNTGYGIYNSGGTLLVENSFISASDYGVYRTNSASTAKSRINNSHIYGNIHSIYSASSNTLIYIGGSLLDASLDPVNGKVTCAGVYDNNYLFFTSTCP